jgi:hypothetical protein
MSQTLSLYVNVTDGKFIRFFSADDIDPTPYVFPPVTDGDVIPIRIRFCQRVGLVYSAVTPVSHKVAIGQRGATAIALCEDWTEGTGDDEDYYLGTLTCASQEISDAIEARTKLYVSVENDAVEIIQQLLATRLAVVSPARTELVLRGDDDLYYRLTIVVLNNVPTVTVSAV